MTAEKMLAVLTYLRDRGNLLRALWIDSYGGELRISGPQFDALTHARLLDIGFVYYDTDYLYRSRKR